MSGPWPPDYERAVTRVRGWLMVGPGPWSWAGSLAPSDLIPQFFGTVPDAAGYQPGTIIQWLPTPGNPQVVLVCVEVPLSF